MKSHFTITEKEAIEFAQIKLMDTVGNLGPITVEIEPNFNDCSLQKPNVARQNKIQLIKFLKDISKDIQSGKLKLLPDDEYAKNRGVSLGDAKTYVEKYFNLI